LLIENNSRVHRTSKNLFIIQVNISGLWFNIKGRYDTEQEANDALLIKKLSL